MDNLSFQHDPSIVSLSSAEHNVVRAHINMVNATADVVVPLNGWRARLRKFWSNYEWRMRHYFYIHLFVFFCNALLGGAIVWGIEGRRVPYIDCWFVSATCVFTCGLQTYDFALLTRPSQIVLLVFTVISGITVSTIPAIIIKIHRVRHESNTTDKSSGSIDNDTLPITRLIANESLDPIFLERLQSLPNAQRIRVTAYILLIVLILFTCFTIYLFTFLAIGIWLTYHYDPKDLLQGNRTINPFYASIIITITGFNQNGLSPWSGGISLLVNDVFMNIFIIFIVMSGTSLFPAIIRGVVDLFKWVVPWRYKIFFDYILLNNHRLSTVIFPSVQTRVYVTITVLLQILGVAVALILDFHNPNLAMFPGGTRFMIFMLETANTRFAGYATIDLSILSTGTLLIFILLMGVKPQMLCTINETPFEMQWVLLQTQQKLENKVSGGAHSGSIEVFLPIDRMTHYLSRQTSLTKARAKRYFAPTTRTTRAIAAMDELTEKRNQHSLSSLSFDGSIQGKNSIGENSVSSARISFLRMKLMLILFCRHMILGLFSLLTSTRTWLFTFLFLICAFDSYHMAPIDPNITIFRIFFELISAFGGCGLSIGYPSVTSSLSTVLTKPSKIILILTMCMGRHRGLLDSMKDQEEIEYSAQTLIDSWRQLAILEQREKKMLLEHKQEPVIPISITERNPSLVTRF